MTEQNINKSLYSLLFILLLMAQAFSQELPFGYPDTERTKISINQGWKFHLGNPDAAYFEKNTDDTTWETVNVPHTLALTSLALDGLQDEKTQLKFHRNVGWYRRNIMVPENNNKVFLEFEGVHQVTDVWVNGKHVGKHGTGGYTPFHFDITRYVDKGKENQVTVLADNRRSMIVPPDPGPFDYVKFSGLYRDVYLVEKHPVHIGFNWEARRAGVTITTPTVDVVNKNATIDIKSVVKNTSGKAENVTVITRVIDAEGLVVLKLIDDANVAQNSNYEFDQIGSLEDNVQLWDVENPYLYRVNTEVLVNGKSVDVVENNLGIRKFELNPDRGFMLNGKPIELMGFNRHQHFPYIGDAVPDALHYKDMLQFKEFGFNIMRTAHYPQDNAILDACDRLGILVYEEAPSWISMSTDKEWWNNFEQSERVMIRNHRNHPSVIIWGGGINHRGYVPVAHNTAKQEDPTRLTASQGSRWTGWQTSGLTDINANMLYGPFIWDRAEPMFAMEGHHGPEALAPFRKDSLMTGLISWTAHAYYTFHPTHDKASNKIDRTRSGGMTIFRNPRPELHWYKAELGKEPFVYMLEDWKKGQDSITVYSNAENVELSVNGKTVATQTSSKDTIYDGLHHAPFIFKNFRYADGEVKAKAIFKDGKTKEVVHKTPGKPHALELMVDTVGRKFTADGADILMAYATVVDKNGTAIKEYNGKVNFSVSKNAMVVGDNANINANPMFTEYGIAPALIRAGTTAGEVKITASAKGLKSANANVQLTAYDPNVLATNARAIYDFKKVEVDMGAHDQLVQFGWDFWHGKDEEKSSYRLPIFNNAEVNLATNSTDGVLRWLGEMNVIGKYGFVYGDGVLGIDENGLSINFKKLPKGKYKLTTYHHAPQSNSDEMDPNKDKLKEIRILNIPYERKLTISAGENTKEVKVTEGKMMQFQEPGKSTILFNVQDDGTAKVNIQGTAGKGIWLNGIELQEWNK
ncbi:glycoside hydrolase family 2 TIM barrel-domain containing protein [Maribacter dokdonensis]|uniref:glycoside hydrolase family 2 TIM barrel-domain containing protein n=1 Tax=Maribacter dokdonensis TaxID=320912 RepID=UPI0027374175|nr:glycoside hydrolase family 2 TIM barrel-domain containing protein [Maribacter dokdonensis]MDP2525081.1 glycoside hydrolase family 2 TIM barrel-domain containing protein [Maribacter dokdonensis]